MRVKYLIEKLQKYDGELDVCFINDDDEKADTLYIFNHRDCEIKNLPRNGKSLCIYVRPEGWWKITGGYYGG